MTVQINCRIPDVCLDPKIEVSHQVLARLPLLISSGIKPAKCPAGAGNHTIRVPDELAAQLEAIGEESGMVLGRVVGGIFYAEFLAAGGVKKPTGTQSSTPTPVTENLRPGQIRCINESAPLLASGKILVSECGTGSGKSRIIAHAAAYVLTLRDAGASIKSPKVFEAEVVESATTHRVPEFLRKYARKAQDLHLERMDSLSLKTEKAVIISAPSVENLSHLAREWDNVKKYLDSSSKYVTSVVLGRGQFVSESRLMEMIDESEEPHPAIEQWLKDGMPAGQIPATQFLLKFQPGLCALMVDLEHLSLQSDFHCADAAMDEDSPKIETALYYDMRKGAYEADIVLTTHAMVCMDNLRLTNDKMSCLLPPALALFVDEAHLLESTQANMAAKSISFQRLMSELRNPLWGSIRKSTLANEAIKMTKDVIEKLSNIPNETAMPISSSSDAHLVRIWEGSRESMRKLENALSGLSASIEKTSPEKLDGISESPDSDAQPHVNMNGKRPKALSKSAKYVQQSLQALKQIAMDHKGHIEHTPKRGCISFVVGPTSVDRYLFSRWAITPTAMMLSGTLHQVGQLGDNTMHALYEMCIPLDRGISTTPIHPTWVTGTPTIYQPSREIFHRFMPPTGDSVNEVSMAAWLMECAKVINHAAKDATGGMLVLMTGYERLEILNRVISEQYPELCHRLITENRMSKLTKNIPRFKDMARSGKKPIWLATGSAWVGLDLADEKLSDKESHKDLILTDLVIPNLPFGLNRSTTHVSKSNRLGFGVEINSTQRLFRQGLGRGVRRDNLQNRRYWILDGRLIHPAAATYTSALRKVLTGYIKRDTFDI